MLRPVIGAIDATLEELSLVLERRDWTGAQAALAELERIEQSLSQDYRHSARQRAMRASVVRALDLAQQGDLEMAFFVIDDATLEPDDVTDAVRQAMAQALEMDGELVLATTEGATKIGPVAVALAGAGVHLRDLTLRTPTLDDVFLEMTGNRMQHDDFEHAHDEQEGAVR